MRDSIAYFEQMGSEQRNRYDSKRHNILEVYLKFTLFHSWHKWHYKSDQITCRQSIRQTKALSFYHPGLLLDVCFILHIRSLFLSTEISWGSIWIKEWLSDYCHVKQWVVKLAHALSSTAVKLKRFEVKVWVSNYIPCRIIDVITYVWRNVG